MTSQIDLFAPKAERQQFVDWLYLEIHAAGAIHEDEIRWRMHAAGYVDELVNGGLERALRVLRDLYLVRRVDAHVWEPCP